MRSRIDTTLLRQLRTRGHNPAGERAVRHRRPELDGLPPLEPAP